MLNVEYSNKSAKFLKKAEKEVSKRILEKIEELMQNPFPSDIKRVVGKRNKAFRVRVGNYRIQYIILNRKNLLFITEIGKRDKAYD